MKKSKHIFLQSLVIICAIAVVLFIILNYRSSISRQVEQQIFDSLRDIAIQDKTALENEIEDRQNFLHGLARELQGFDTASESREEIVEGLKPLADIYHFKRIGLTDAVGNVLTTDGYENNLSYREFFKVSVTGKDFISGTLNDTMGEQEKINVFSVPVYGSDGRTVIGVLFATYQTDTFKDLIATQSFDGASYKYIVNARGEVIASGENELLSDEKNLFTGLRNLSDGDEKTAQTIRDIESNMRKGENGSAKLWVDGEKYAYYAAANIQLSGDTCYILTLVPSDILSERQDLLWFYINILLVILVVIAFIACLIFYRSYRSNRQILHQLAYNDSLTGGLNYTGFLRELKKLKGSAGGYLLYMDLTAFKVVNNTCGIARGDEVLKEVWLILRRAKMPDEYLAHLTSDNYVMFLTSRDKKEVRERIEKISKDIRNLSDTMDIPNIEPHFGICRYTANEPAETGIGRAYEVKNITKDRTDASYAFYDELDFSQVVEEKKLEDNFAEAIKNNRFEVWYQPKYSASGEKLVGAEALVRWRSADGELIPPYKFIPLFERNGMISTLDEYMFRKVCEQQKKWKNAGLSMLPISVNISRASLYYRNVVIKYRKILNEYGIDPRFVPLEITESATVDNADIKQLVDDFHTFGFPLLLDDFGSGYSSLAGLNLIHFDILKIDKSLVDYIGNDRGEKLLYYTIQLAKSLGMSITAEGVEDKEQLQFLQKLSCDDIQGFYFSKPLPYREYEEKLLHAG